MRITVLCTDLGVRVPGSKGASMHLASITRAFANNGHAVQLIGVAGHGDPPDGLVDTLLFAHPGRAEGIRRERNKLAFVEQVTNEAWAAVRAFEPDVIYERLSLFGDAGKRLRRRLVQDGLAVRHVLEVNALLAEEEAKWRGLHHDHVATERERAVLDSADLVVAVSDETRSAVRRVAPDARCVVIPNGVEVERFRVLPDKQESRAANGLPADVPLACFVGALRPWHGVDLAIDAIERTMTGFHLAIVGDGPIRGDLERLAGQLGVADRVHFLGQLDHAGVAAVLAASDAALAPYPRLEGFAFSPLKLYEYLATGVPVFASRIGQVPSALWGGEFGTLVRPGDAAQLGLELDRYVADPGPALARAAAAREHALVHHGWTNRAADTVAHIAKLTCGGR